MKGYALLLLLLGGCSLLAKPYVQSAEDKPINPTWNGTYILFRGSNKINPADPYANTLSIRIVSNYISIRSDAGKALLRVISIAEEQPNLIKMWTYPEAFVPSAPSAKGRASITPQAARASAQPTLEDIYGAYVPDLSKIDLNGFLPIILDRRSKSIFKVSAGFDKMTANTNGPFPKAAPEMQQNFGGVDIWAPKPPAMLAADELYTSFYYYTSNTGSPGGGSSGGSGNIGGGLTQEEIDAIGKAQEELYDKLFPTIKPEGDPEKDVLLPAEANRIYVYYDPNPVTTRTLWDFDQSNPLTGGIESIKVAGARVSVQNGPNRGVYKVENLVEDGGGGNIKAWLRPMAEDGTDSQGFPAAKALSPSELLAQSPDAPLFALSIENRGTHYRLGLDSSAPVPPSATNSFPPLAEDLQERKTPYYAEGFSEVKDGGYVDVTVLANDAAPPSGRLKNRFYVDLQWLSPLPSAYVGWYLGSISRNGFGDIFASPGDTIYFNGKGFVRGHEDRGNVTLRGAFVHFWKARPLSRGRELLELFTDKGYISLIKQPSGHITFYQAQTPDLFLGGRGLLRLSTNPYGGRFTTNLGTEPIVHAYAYTGSWGSISYTGDGTQVIDTSHPSYSGVFPTALLKDENLYTLQDKCSLIPPSSGQVIPVRLRTVSNQSFVHMDPARGIYGIRADDHDSLEALEFKKAAEDMSADMLLWDPADFRE